jgi:Dyp-type peroxidase family
VNHLDFKGTQAIVHSGYGRLPHSRFSLLIVESQQAWKAHLQRLLPKITGGLAKPDEWAFNIALTAPGLEALGISKEDLATFSLPFQQGMAQPDRARALGDIGDNAAANWLWGTEKNPVHVLAMVFAKDESILAARQLEFVDAMVDDGSCKVVGPELMGEPAEKTAAGFSREHFGFADGVSQPVISGSIAEGSSDEQKLKRRHGEYWRHSLIAPGEFLLGYENEYGQTDKWPTVAERTELGKGRDFGLDGTYLVMRQLGQDVSAFWEFLDRQVDNLGEEERERARLRLAAKLVGRWPSGASMVAHPDTDPNPTEQGGINDFLFGQTDPQGYACPVGSHVRRTNPRDLLDDDPELGVKLSNRHRILRRGRNYGANVTDPFDKSAADRDRERGLIFICLNANIARQFEFIQQTWVNNTKFQGLYEESDPLIGRRGERVLTIQRRPVRQHVHGLESFVTVRGGAYFFLPGIDALRHLSS